MIDLRSDTVTVPDTPMRTAMVDAVVGDDQYGEDPTVNALQSRTADMLGKEAALFVPSGTMANQIALRLLTLPGEEVVVGQESHVAWHEAGAAPANAGVQFREIGVGGLFGENDLIDAYKPRDHVVFPATTLVVLENTHNRGGGVVFPQPDVEAICARAAQLGIRSYLDGARLFNAAVKSATDVKQLAAPFDMVSISLSKGLGCPIGSVLAGSSADMSRAVRIRRMLGGAWRQAGILAAAGIYALENNIHRLADDHENARLIAEAIAENPAIVVDLETVQTNIVVFELEPSAPDAAAFVSAAAKHGVLVSPFGRRKVRVTTHMNVSRSQCQQAAGIMLSVLSGG